MTETFINSSLLTNKDKQKQMSYRKDKVSFLFYPEDDFKQNWDSMISLVLIASSTITPVQIAFGDIDEPLG